MSFLSYHDPVLVDETLEHLCLKPGYVCVDCTLGGAGHGIEIVKKIIPDGLYIAIDKDEDAINEAKNRLKAYDDNILLVKDDYSNIADILKRYNIKTVNAVLMDLGVSSHQLDTGNRGFSYWDEAPLDMRMDKQQNRTVRDMVNDLSVDELSHIIKNYGEERWAHRIAGCIVTERKKNSIEKTSELVEIIKKAIPAKYRRKGPHPARRTFQAFRIALNDELVALKKGLKEAINVMSKDGFICIISYHSLEDRIVKRALKEYSNNCQCPPDFPICKCNRTAVLEQVTRKPVVPSEKEINENPRARSAKLRVAKKL